MQKTDWKSLGCEINFKIVGSKEIDVIRCFTTRPDTLFGFSLAVSQIISFKHEDNAEFKNFKKECSKTGTTEEFIAQATKIGFKTDLLVINPLDKWKKVPIFC